MAICFSPRRGDDAVIAVLIQFFDGQAIDLAAFLGSPIIRLFCKTMPEKNGDGDDPWPAMVSGYQEVADYAATKGIAIGLQNHPSTGDEMLRIRRETNRENFNFIQEIISTYIIIRQTAPPINS